MAFIMALVNLANMVAALVAVHKGSAWLAGDDGYLYWFLCLFAWRYLRFVVNLVAFWCYSPSPMPKGQPTYLPSRDVTVIIPTVDPRGAGFQECVRSCAENRPAKIVIITAGDELYAQTVTEVRQLEQRFASTRFVVDRTQVANKRTQVALGVSHLDTAIAVLLDDHAFWGPRFLQAILCPFEDREVGLVGTNKRVRRAEGLGVWSRFWNMLGATYLMRHNFEIRATNTVDGGVFVVSGRTCAMRTEILRHPEFLPGYTNEKFFFGLLGPLNPDDDNYNTRFVVSRGWKIKIQYSDDAEMQTTIGVDHPVASKFLGQCRRWARTTWRSNLCSFITDRSVWARQPYCVYAVYLTSLTNFAAVTDPLLVYLFARSSACVSSGALACLVSWILLTKLTKVFPYFRRHPQDAWLFPAYVGFAYFHSLIKLWALLTFWDCSWSGRRLDQINTDPAAEPTAANSSSKQQQQQQHLATFRSLGLRVTDLGAQHAAHQTRYQQPILNELKQLRGGFESLQREQAAILDELAGVAARARDLGAAQTGAAEAEAHIGEAVARMGAAVGAVEERWRAYLAAVAAGQAGAAAGNGSAAGGNVGDDESF